jgi:hypothetical protein
MAQCMCTHHVLVNLYSQFPKVTLNPIDSHKSMYYTVYCKVNNDHHGDLLPLGHLGCPSRGSTAPWVKSKMGEPRPPEDISLYHNHIAIIVSLWGDTLATV